MVGVIIPVVNNSELTIKCLEHLYKYTKLELKTVIVDNKSTDKHFTSVWKKFNQLTNYNGIIILNLKNLGFSFAINQGIEKLNTITDIQSILFLNNDCFVGPECIDRMQWHLDNNIKLGAVVPMTNGPNTSSLYKGSRSIRFTKVIEYLKQDNIEKASFELALICNNRELSIVGASYCPFFCCLIKQQCLTEVGNLNADLFPSGLAVDDNWCRRAINKNWQLGYAVDALALHIGHATFKDLKLNRTQLQQQAIKQLQNA